VLALVSTDHGVTEPAMATELVARQIDLAEHAPESLGADKGYHSAEVVGFCRAHSIRPHVPTIQGRQVPGLDGRTTRKRGVARVGLSTLLILTAYNLVRRGKLLGGPPGTERLATA